MLIKAETNEEVERGGRLDLVSTSTTCCTSDECALEDVYEHMSAILSEVARTDSIRIPSVLSLSISLSMYFSLQLFISNCMPPLSMPTLSLSLSLFLSLSLSPAIILSTLLSLFLSICPTECLSILLKELTRDK